MIDFRNRRQFIWHAAGAPLLAMAARLPASGLEPPRPALSLEEIIIIQDFFKGEGAPLIPVMDAIQARIPPTYLRRAVIGRPLAPEIRKFIAAMPKELTRKLPISPPGLQLALLGRRVILISTREQVLHDSLVINAPRPGAKKK